MALIFEILIFSLIITALFLCFQLIRTIAKGVMNVIFWSFTLGIFLFGASRLLLLLADSGVYQLHEVTLHIWWHIIFYLGVLSFIWGGMRLTEIAKSQTPVGFSQKDKIIFAVFLLITAGIFVIAMPLEATFTPLLVDSPIDKLGLHHGIAVILGLVAAFYLFTLKSTWGKLLTVGIMPIIAFLALIGLQHLWEFLAESLKVIVLPDATIEFVEQLIVIPALLFFNFALLRILKVIKVNATPQAS